MAVALRDFQLFQMGLLSELDRICSKHGLTYWGGYGTLLGAARHQGFIPWDDDIDVMMPAEDYYRFREVAPAELPEGLYVQCHCINSENIIPFMRIGDERTTSMPYDATDIFAEWGIDIDIFPLSAADFPDEESRRALDKRFAKLLKLTRQPAQYRHDAKKLSGLRKAYHMVKASVSPERNVRKWLRQERLCFPVADFAGVQYVYDCYGNFYPSSLFEETVYLPFEDRRIPAPAGYREILAITYGDDWFEMPPAEKRVCHSGGGNDEVMVYFDRPYREFLQQNQR